MSRSRRAAWTFGLSLAVTLSGVLTGLLATPLLLRYLGDERVGAYRVGAEWVGYLVLLDFGLTGALQVAFARALGTGDRAAIATTVRAGVRMGAILAVASAVVAVGLVLLAPWMLRGMSPDVASELQLGLLIALAGILWIPLIAFRPLAEAGQRGHIVQLALVVQLWVTAGLAVGFAASGGGLPGQFLAVVIGNGLMTLLLLRDALRNYPEILTRPQTAAAVTLPVTFSGSMFAYNLLGRIGLHSDAIVLGLSLGPAAVVAFTVTQRLLLLADAQVMSLGTAVWPALAELHHQGKTDQFNYRLTQLTRWTGVMAFALIVPFAAFTRPFVALWVGVERVGDDLLIVATAVYVWAHTLAALWGWPLITTGHVRAVLPIYLIGVPLNVAISVGGCFWVGVAGPALGSAVSVVLLWLPWLPLLLRQRFRTPLRPLAGAVLRPALLGVPLAVALFALSAAFPIDELPMPAWVRWLVLLVGMAIGFAAYLGLAWFLILPREDRAEVRDRVFGP